MDTEHPIRKEDVERTLHHLNEALKDSPKVTRIPKVVPKEETPIVEENEEACDELLTNDATDNPEDVWRMSGEIRELLSVALGVATLSRFPHPDLSVHPRVFRDAHRNQAVADVEAAETLEGLDNRTNEEIHHAMKHTVAANRIEETNGDGHPSYKLDAKARKSFHAESSPKSDAPRLLSGCSEAFRAVLKTQKETSDRKDAEEREERKEKEADAVEAKEEEKGGGESSDETPPTAFIVRSLRRVADPATSPISSHSSDATALLTDEACTSLLRSLVELEHVRNVTTPEERDDYVRSACIWFRHEAALAAHDRDGAAAFANETCARLHVATERLDTLARKRAKLRDFDCRTESPDDPSKRCSGKGVCKCQGRCFCPPGRSGVACEIATCGDAGCGLHGYCVDGTCRCARGWIGPACEYEDCPTAAAKADTEKERCSGHGICTLPKTSDPEKKSEEKAKYQKDTDENKPDSFTPDVGKAHDEKYAKKAMCLCGPGWTGNGCQLRTCPYGLSSAETPEMCSGHGACDERTGTCTCDVESSTGQAHFVGDACERCANQEHMTCTTIPEKTENEDDEGGVMRTTCQCHEGYFGACCDRTGCLNGCSGRGSCDQETAVCTCDEGFYGPACEHTRPSCGGENACGKNGVCVPVPSSSGDGGERDERAGICRCEPGYTGERCEKPDCPMGCLAPNRGACDSGTGACVCKIGFHGEACEGTVDVDNTYEEEEEETSPSPTSFLEIGARKTVECYWQCLRECVLEDCVQEKEEPASSPDEEESVLESAGATGLSDPAEERRRREEEALAKDADQRRIRWRSSEADAIASIASNFQDADEDAKEVYAAAKAASMRLTRTVDDVMQEERDAVYESTRAAAEARRKMGELQRDGVLVDGLA
eukprot:g4660.t1